MERRFDLSASEGPDSILVSTKNADRSGDAVRFFLKLKKIDIFFLTHCKMKIIYFD
jgi:hypothetical protein